MDCTKKEAMNPSSLWVVVASGKFDALRLEGHRFESHTSRHVGTLGKWLWRVNSDTASML